MAPKKIFIQPDEHDRWFEGDNPNDKFVEYIRKDAHDDIVKTAEDNAFLAGAEWEKEKMPKWKLFNPILDKTYAESEVAKEIDNSVLTIDEMGYIWYIPRDELRKLPKEEE